MSEFTIKDGTGSGYRAGVTSDNQMRTTTIAQPRIAFISDAKGLSFTLPIMNYSLGTADNEYNLLYFKNIDPNRHFHAMRYFMSWNGGDTNHNRSCDARLYVGSSAPTANNVEFQPGNLNLISANVALAEAHLWNGVSTGMTVSSQGTKAQAAYLTQGVAQLDLDGSFIIGFNQSFLVTATPEEAGKISVIISGYYESPDIE